MRLKVLLPSKTLLDTPQILRIVAETTAGSLGLLPHRLDCAAALTPGILSYETEADGEVYLAVDEGILVKVGQTVTVIVRRALQSQHLAELQQLVSTEFLTLNADEVAERSLKAKLESGFLKRFASFQHD
jgi:F-type H+-transporting ATPase subunit epsilon